MLYIILKNINSTFRKNINIQIGFARVGGYEAVVSKFSYSISSSTLYSNTTCGLPNSNYFDLVRSIDSDFPWLGMSLGLLISSIWYWCSE